MKKLTYGLVIFSIAGIISGLLVVGIFMQPNTSREPAYLGMIYIAFNILILFLYNLVRNIILIISSLYICLNITNQWAGVNTGIFLSRAPRTVRFKNFAAGFLSARLPWTTLNILWVK